MNELRARTKRFAAGFISKLSIALEEIDETAFWLEFLPDTRLGSSESVTPLLREADELSAIFMPSRKTARANAKKNRPDGR
jgi:four helix bundle protein